MLSTSACHTAERSAGVAHPESTRTVANTIDICFMAASVESALPAPTMATAGCALSSDGRRWHAACIWGGMLKVLLDNDTPDEASGVKRAVSEMEGIAAAGT